ncbi:beta-galactosidase 7-like [Prosopis cineraria]|uniref:beta-galactosidase 7-like n=1 Tax=Prosopis cineraria TaxID=364024 RepID=UPI0024108F7D|nr:beta-galactosidase 7-like [Prosopis cineraria]
MGSSFHSTCSSWTKVVLFSLSLLGLCSATAIEVSYDQTAFIINGERRVILSGAVHFPRSTEKMWPQILQKAKDSGLDAIETYVFWDRHEPVKGKYDFKKNLNFVKFFKLVQEHGLYGIIRIGPYVCAEWNFGGLPLWLHKIPGIQVRTDNEPWKKEMQTFVTKIVTMCKEANLFASQGGPIILAQIENEYGNIMSGYGDAGKQYVKWCAEMALAQNIGVPWIMCQQNDAPSTVIQTCNGFYCDSFQPNGNNPKNPKVFTENWVGWFQKWGEKLPHRTAEDVAYSVARFFQNGGVLNNYYMFHGGTNFERTAGGPYITTSYDYDAPLNEYGTLNQPKYGHLKQLHAAIKSGEKIITSATRTETSVGNSVNLTTYTSSNGGKFCYLSNTDGSQDATVDLPNGGGKFFVPAWSVSILENCSKEIYNTAKVNTQTSLMVKKVDASSAHLTWEWMAENIEDTLSGKGTSTENLLLEQKDFTLDASDYLWYMTTVNINDTSSWQNATLQVVTMGHALYAYVNKNLVGSQFSQTGGNFTFEKPVSLTEGTNIITLLSVTVGLPNYGAKYDLIDTGIVDGPVKLIGKNSVSMDLTNNSWSYKTGLNGEAQRLRKGVWKSGSSNNLPVGKGMTWYKAKFNVPSGTDPVVLDLQGMGKGEAWVNGHGIGRYWPLNVAGSDGCSQTCDYRGAYQSSKCTYNCGNPTQRWYHVPRQYFSNKENILVLFEEVGGNPQNISFQTVSVGTVCANAYEGANLELSCEGGKMSKVEFASFGNPQGQCGSFQKGSSDASTSMSVVEKACAGKPACTLAVTKETFGAQQISGASGNSNTTNINRLAVQIAC